MSKWKRLVGLLFLFSGLCLSACGKDETVTVTELINIEETTEIEEEVRENVVDESILTYFVETHHLTDEWATLRDSKPITMSDGNVQELYLIWHEIDLQNMKYNLTYSGILVDGTDNSSQILFQIDKLCDEMDLSSQTFYEFYDMQICDVDGNGEDDIILILGTHGTTGWESYLPNLFCMIGLQEDGDFNYITSWNETWLEAVMDVLYDEDRVNWKVSNIYEDLKNYFGNESRTGGIRKQDDVNVIQYKDERILEKIDNRSAFFDRELLWGKLITDDNDLQSIKVYKEFGERGCSSSVRISVYLYDYALEDAELQAVPDVYAELSYAQMSGQYVDEMIYFKDVELKEITYEDVNGDGLKDIRMTIDCMLETDEKKEICETYEIVYLQEENGNRMKKFQSVLEDRKDEVKASGGEVIEGSQLEQFEKANVPLFDGFAEMNYCLFLETHLDYGVSLDYYRYGIYGDFVRTTREGEELYFNLNEKMLGNKLNLYTHTEWYYSAEPFIQNITPDLELIISRQYTDVAAKMNIDRAYYQKQEVGQKEWNREYENAFFELQKKEDDGTYELMEDETLKRWDEITMAVWDRNDSLYDFVRRSISSIDEYGKLLAVAMPDNTGIEIYSMESGEELQHMEIADNIDTDWPIEISQIKGTAESGWLVFSNGDVTYRMTYPDGGLEKMGEFMYGTTFSPDEKYLAYCTGNRILGELCLLWSDKKYAQKYEKWQQMYERWETAGSGWYVEELETGKKTYIYIEPWQEDYGSTIRDGRCVWIQKDKLLQIVTTIPSY